MAAVRVRSVSFSGAINAGTVSPLKRGHGLSTCTPHARAPRKQPRISVTSIQARSCWGGHPRRRTRIGWRLSSSVHKPDCRWMRSSRHPQATPRDKDCPACQDAEKRPEELSPSELWWERRMQRFRDAVDKDAYDTIFGWSNDMLRGRPLRPRWFWEDEIKPWSLKGVQEDTVTGFKERMLHDKTIFDKVLDPSTKAAKATTAPEKPQQPPTTSSKAASEANARPTKKVKVEAEPAKKIPVKQPQQQVKASNPHFEAYSSWSYTSVNSSGKSVARSGASIYDPISGRMVPIATPEPPKEPAADAAAAKAPQPLRSCASSGSPSDNTSTKTASGENSNATHKQEAIVEGHRSVQYEQAHNSLSRAQKSVESLRETYMSRPKEMSPALAEPPSLALTHSRLQSTQLALKQYKALALKSGVDMSASGNTSAGYATPDRTAADDHLNESGMKRKTTLESSWRSEQQRKTPPGPAPGHFRQRSDGMPADDVAGVAKLAYNALHRRKGVPLKHMNAHELGLHRQYLVEAWAKQQRDRSEAQTRSKTAADQRLDQEVQALRTQHAAWESRWTQSRSSAAPSTTEAPKPAFTTAEITNGEGDMCPNVAKFCNPDRMYKRRAPHAMMAEDTELAQNLKNIYEEAYGTIDENHRQGKRTMTQQALDQQEVHGIQPERQTVGPDRAVKHVKVEKRPLKSKVQQNFAASQAMTNDDSRVTRSATDAAEAGAINAYEIGTARKGLPTVRDRRLESSQMASQTSTTAAKPTSIVAKPEASVATTTRTAAPEAALFRLVKYEEATGRIEETSASTHPDKWSMPRLSANTAFEMLRDKKGYQQHLVPLMQQLRRNGYVLYDLARDDKTIVFMRQPTTVPTALPNRSTMLSTASSGSYPSILHKDPTIENSTKATTNGTSPRIRTTNPVDPSLRLHIPQTQTGNFASPTGYVNLEVPEAATTQSPKSEAAISEKPSADGLNARALNGLSIEEKLTTDANSASRSASPGQQSQKINKQEPVFSGSKSSSEQSETDDSLSFGARIGLTVVFVGSVAWWFIDQDKEARERERLEKRKRNFEKGVPFWDEDRGRTTDILKQRLEPVEALLWEDATQTSSRSGIREASVRHERAGRQHAEEQEIAQAARAKEAKEKVQRETFEQASRHTESVSKSMSRSVRTPARILAEQRRKEHVAEALADVTMMSLSLGVVGWVFLRMLER